MDTWNAKYRNKWNEYEVKFCSDDYEKAKAVERVCQYIMDGEITSRSDVAPVRRGQWIEDKNTFPGFNLANNVCSECGECAGTWPKRLGPRDKYAFCPWCGARMEVQNG